MEPHERRSLAAACLASLLCTAVGLAACRAPADPAGRAAPPVEEGGAPRAPQHLTIELLALDLATCGRCTGTERNLDAALRTVSAMLAKEGVAVEVRKEVVRTAERAVALRFASSPTIRVDGRDIALEVRENSCRDCGDLCGGGVEVDCRVWVWRGREYVEAPEPMIVDAILRAREEGPAPPPSAPFRLPDNLRRFFAARG